jgi:hypothetical protein
VQQKDTTLNFLFLYAYTLTIMSVFTLCSIVSDNLALPLQNEVTESSVDYQARNLF